MQFKIMKNLTVTTNRIILFIRQNIKCACISVQINRIMQTLPRNHENLPLKKLLIHSNKML